MIYTYPDYYNEFKCVADKCEATCCCGWQVMIDEESFFEYRHYKGKYKGQLRKKIDWKNQCFKQKGTGRCAFLNKRNLCDMQLEMGEDCLCKICSEYPRHIEEFENVREIMLSVSCPVVAEMLMEKRDKVTFISKETDETEEFEEFDELFYSLLNDARESINFLVQNRELSIDLRMYLTLAIAHDLQVRINSGRFFSFDEVFEKYFNLKVQNKVNQKLNEFKNKKIKRCNYNRQIFKQLYKFEHLLWGHEIYLYRTERILYKKGVDNYCRTDDMFRKWCACNNIDLEIKLEQLLVYFINTYFCGSVYDADVYGKIYMCVMSVFLLYEMMKAKWCKNNKQLSKHDIVKIVYTYSRELEHSDINLDRFEKCVKIKL